MIFYLSIIIFFGFISNASANLKITTSIKPIHSIVFNLTKNISKPQLLFNNNKSPHNFHLKPSQLKYISNADLIVTIHPNFELGLKKSLVNIAKNKQFIIANMDDLILNTKKHYNKQIVNYHLWLDIANMQTFAKKLTKRLIEIDKKNQAIYNKNLTSTNIKLEQLKQDIKRRLMPYQSTPIAVFSNVFSYFIEANNLNNPTIITNFHNDRLSIYKILKAKKAIKNHKITCLLATSNVSSKKIKILTKNLKINAVKIDVIGFNLKADSELYFKLIENIITKAELCLKSN